MVRNLSHRDSARTWQVTIQVTKGPTLFWHKPELRRLPAAPGESPGPVARWLLSLVATSRGWPRPNLKRRLSS